MKYLHSLLISFPATVLCSLLLSDYPPGASSALAEELPEHNTAGEAYDTGAPEGNVASQPRDRENVRSVILGVSLYAPDLAGHTVAPIGAVFYKHRFDDIRVRGIFSIFTNDFSVSKSYDQFQLLGHLQNRTYPFTNTEIVEGKEIPGTALKWGTVDGRVGAGWRLPVSPFQVDNDLRVQLYYQLGYQYSHKVSDSGPEVVLPPDTFVHGPLLRVRYDGLRRNAMELPDQGLAASMDAQYLTRSNWSRANYSGSTFTKAETQQFLKVSGYLIFATGLPHLSEKNRLLASGQIGYAPYGTLDRFSAFRVGGGQIPTDADDLDRHVYPGAMFNQFPVFGYLITSLEYRREVLPSLYFHLRGAFTRTESELFTLSGHGHFKTEEGQMWTAAATSKFYGDSQLHLAYTYDTRLLRNGASGSNIVLLLSKPF